MVHSSLIVYKGGRKVDRPEVGLIEAPPPTKTWFPLSHGHVLSTVEETLSQAGYGVRTGEFALSADNHRFFGTLTLDSLVAPGISLAVGVRNSTDQTFPIGICCGSRVMVCENLAFSADIYVSRKHTRWGKERFHEGISQAIGTLAQYREVEASRIETYRQVTLSETEASATLLHGFESGILSSRTLPIAIQEWRHPTHPDFEPRTAFSLFNAFTAALKERQGMPSVFASLTIKAYGLLDRQVNFTQVV